MYTLYKKTVSVKRVSLGAMTIYEGLEVLWTFWFAPEHHKWWSLDPFEDKQVGLVQIMRAKGKNCWEAVEIGNGKAKFILIWHSTVQNLPNGIDSWLEQLYVMATLRMSRRSGQIKLRSCIHLTDGIAHFVTWMVANCWINWHLTVAKCAVPSGLSHRPCCNKRAVRICVASCFNCTEGDPSLVAMTLRSNTILQSSLAPLHPVQCSPNMRVADCATVWVCKC